MVGVRISVHAKRLGAVEVRVFRLIPKTGQWHREGTFSTTRAMWETVYLPMYQAGAAAGLFYFEYDTSRQHREQAHATLSRD